MCDQMRAHICRGKNLVLPILSSTAPLDLSNETRLMCEPGNYEPGMSRVWRVGPSASAGIL